METTFEAQKYPSLDVAYDRLDYCYDLPQRRMDVIEGRISALSGIAVSLALAVPALASGDPDFAALPLLLAVAIAFAVAVTGLWHVHKGTLRVSSPTLIRDQYLDLPPEEARYTIFYYAAQHFADNMLRVQRKAAWLDGLMLAFIAEAALLAWWLLG